MVGNQVSGCLMRQRDETTAATMVALGEMPTPDGVSSGSEFSPEQNVNELLEGLLEGKEE